MPLAHAIRNQATHYSKMSLVVNPKNQQTLSDFFKGGNNDKPAVVVNNHYGQQRSSYILLALFLVLGAIVIFPSWMWPEKQACDCQQEAEKLKAELDILKAKFDAVNKQNAQLEKQINFVKDTNMKLEEKTAVFQNSSTSFYNQLQVEMDKNHMMDRVVANLTVVVQNLTSSLQDAIQEKEQAKWMEQEARSDAIIRYSDLNKAQRAAVINLCTLFGGVCTGAFLGGYRRTAGLEYVKGAIVSYKGDSITF